ncbi:MAG TPA: hypothetical protein PLV68_11985 [Ilumatobacteraceae bacterium]|nr:hypothetical protein [Ilumatobacteraceae bacterium]
MLAAYLAARYPAADDPVWDDPGYPIRPARAAATVKRTQQLTYPVIIESA